MVADGAYPEAMDDRVWTRRLRWRLRGARLWPSFALLTLLDGLLVHHNPIAGDRTGVVPGILLAGFLNLVAIVLVAPLLARRLRGGRPREIAEDRAGTAVIVAVTVALGAIGLAHAGAVDHADRDMAAQLAAARRYFAVSAPPAYRAHRDRLDTWKQAEDLYRTCIPGPDSDHALCVFVTTDSRPPGVRLDPDQEPNSVLAGPDNPGRR
jgi:hypothetical protein